MRASFIMWNMAARPRPSSPTRSPTAPSFSPKLSRVLVVPRKPILWLRPARVTSLRVPSGSSFGTMNRLRPFTPSGAPATRASTRCTMFSDSSCSPAEIHILLPNSR